MKIRREGPRSSRLSEPDGTAGDATLTSSLDALDDAVNYMRWIVDLIQPYLTGTTLELGAGHGTFTAAFADHGPVVAVEPGIHAAELLGQRFAGDERVTVVEGVVDDLADTRQFGTAVMVNVLEHIDDDHAALVAIAKRLTPGGHVAIWVPAFELLYSEFDRKLGHHRRYRRLQLESLVRSAGYDIVESRYVNLPGWFSWLIISRLLRQEPTNGPLVKIFDRSLVPVIRWTESHVRPPFGQSILLVARTR